MESVLSVMARNFGYQDYKPGQKEIIDGILNNLDILGVMPTGGGKSLCYQLPALILPGITLVISPLIALMKDQVDSLITQGVSASYINSSLSLSEIRNRFLLASTGKTKILYIAPERLESEDFTELLCNLSISLIAIDEAHCVSQWGHDFRPSYLRIGSWIKTLPYRPIIATFTATATTQVQEDIIKQLGLKNPKTIINSFDRKNLYFSVNKGVARFRFISDYLEKHSQQSGIIYAATRKEVESIYEQLKTKGYSVTKYHAGLNTAERSKNQDDFLFDRIKVMVATNAFGMGIDKSNISFVIHHNMPRHLEAYYQEAGRAGRDGQPADCILLYHAGDIQVQKFFIENANLPPDRKESEYEKLKSMIDYCHSTRCLREKILSYFEEKEIAENCDNCANCQEQEIIDISIEAQKIFSCIIRMKNEYGAKLIANVLKGSKQKRVLALGFDMLSTYGIMDNLTIEQIVEYLNILAAEGYLSISSGQYPVVKLMTKAMPVLRGQEKIFIRQAKKVAAITPENELFQALRQLRADIATQQNVPPYIIFADKTLSEMCEQLPLSQEAMLCINGIGEVKFKKYGEQFLEVIQSFAQTSSADLDIDFTKIDDNFAKDTSSETKSKKTSKKHGKEPTYVQTWQMYQDNKDLSDIAKERGLTLVTIENHIIKASEEGYLVDWYEFISEEIEVKILETSKIIGVEKLRPLKDALDKDISYFAIKIVLSKNQLNAPNPQD